MLLFRDALCKLWAKSSDDRRAFVSYYVPVSDKAALQTNMLRAFGQKLTEKYARPALTNRRCTEWRLRDANRSKKTQMSTTNMKHYESSEWKFALDIPRRWNSFPPPVSTNSPYEVIRFVSREEGTHLLIIFRKPHDPKQSLKDIADQVQQVLASGGFGNFATAETSLGSRAALMLDFDRPQGDGTWSCREYFVVEGTLGYTLGFGTTNKAGMFELYDRVAKSFEILAE